VLRNAKRFIYVTVVQDMIDGTGDYDQVSGYTIRQIEDALNGIQTWDAWKNKIINILFLNINPHYS